MRSALISILLTVALAGCADRSPPPPRIDVPRDAGEGMIRTHDPAKPLPGEEPWEETPPPPEIRDTAPPRETPRPPPRQEVRGFDDSIPAPPYDDAALVDQELPERRAFVETYREVGRPAIVIEGINQSDVFAGQDRAAALIFSEWMRSDGEVVILSNRGNALPDVVIEFNVEDRFADKERTALNLSARAINGVDRAILGQAMVDMPLPADRGALNRYTRFLARKLMSDMTRSWRTKINDLDDGRAAPTPNDEGRAPLRPMDQTPASRPS